jgi:hypothetical protein
LVNPVAAKLMKRPAEALIRLHSARSYARPALSLVGAAARLLLFIGIHNAWDTVTHLVFVRKQAEPSK